MAGRSSLSNSLSSGSSFELVDIDDVVDVPSRESSEVLVGSDGDSGSTAICQAGIELRIEDVEAEEELIMQQDESMVAAAEESAANWVLASSSYYRAGSNAPVPPSAEPQVLAAPPNCSPEPQSPAAFSLPPSSASPECGLTCMGAHSIGSLQTHSSGNNSSCKLRSDTTCSLTVTPLIQPSTCRAEAVDGLAVEVKETARVAAAECGLEGLAAAEPVVEQQQDALAASRLDSDTVAAMAGVELDQNALAARVLESEMVVAWAVVEQDRDALAARLLDSDYALSASEGALRSLSSRHAATCAMLNELSDLALLTAQPKSRAASSATPLPPLLPLPPLPPLPRLPPLLPMSPLPPKALIPRTAPPMPPRHGKSETPTTRVTRTGGHGPGVRNPLGVKRGGETCILLLLTLLLGLLLWGPWHVIATYPDLPNIHPNAPCQSTGNTPQTLQQLQQPTPHNTPYPSALPHTHFSKDMLVPFPAYLDASRTAAVALLLAPPSEDCPCQRNSSGSTEPLNTRAQGSVGAAVALLLAPPCDGCLCQHSSNQPLRHKGTHEGSHTLDTKKGSHTLNSKALVVKVDGPGSLFSKPSRKDGCLVSKLSNSLVTKLKPSQLASFGSIGGGAELGGVSGGVVGRAVLGHSLAGHEELMASSGMLTGHGQLPTEGAHMAQGVLASGWAPLPASAFEGGNADAVDSTGLVSLGGVREGSNSYSNNVEHTQWRGVPVACHSFGPKHTHNALPTHGAALFAAAIDASPLGDVKAVTVADSMHKKAALSALAPVGPQLHSSLTRPAAGTRTNQPPTHSISHPQVPPTTSDAHAALPTHISRRPSNTSTDISTGAQQAALALAPAANLTRALAIITGTRALAVKAGIAVASAPHTAAAASGTGTALLLHSLLPLSNQRGMVSESSTAVAVAVQQGSRVFASLGPVLGHTHSRVYSSHGVHTHKKHTAHAVRQRQQQQHGEREEHRGKGKKHHDRKAARTRAERYVRNAIRQAGKAVKRQAKEFRQRVRASVKKVKNRRGWKTKR